MIDDDEILNQRLSEVRTKTLDELSIPHEKWGEIFSNRFSTRLNTDGFKKLSSVKKFYSVKFKVDSFSMVDLVKIAKLNNDLFYIDTKNTTVITCDNDFSIWVNLLDGNIYAIRQ